MIVKIPHFPDFSVKTKDVSESVLIDAQRELADINFAVMYHLIGVLTKIRL